MTFQNQIPTLQRLHALSSIPTTVSSYIFVPYLNNGHIHSEYISCLPDSDNKNQTVDYCLICIDVGSRGL